MYMCDKMENETLKRIAYRMNETDPCQIKALLGFDGFVDQIVHVVDVRYDTDHFKRVKTLEDYGKKICNAAGLSLNVEMVPVKTKIGGNGTILADALVNQGMKITYIGAMGKDSINPVFKELASRIEVISLSDPAFTDAIEFMDGKIISSKLESFKDISWNTIENKVGQDRLLGILEENDLLGFENWTMIVRMTEIWENMIDKILPRMSMDKKRVLFIDLADPEKRTQEDIMSGINCLRKFEAYFETILGLNEKESYEIAELFGKGRNELPDVTMVADFLKEQTGISGIVIHTLKQACGVIKDEKAIVDGPYCDKPLLTTGAGDNFNAGFLTGKMMGLGLQESLLMGTANSGYYVRKAGSASYGELRQFILDWSEGYI